MKTVLLSLILVLSPTVALADITPQTREILKDRACQYLKSGFTRTETVSQIAYHVEENYPGLRPVRTGRDFGIELHFILADYLSQTMGNEITSEAIQTKCPQFGG